MAVLTGYNIVLCCFTITCRATASVEYHYIGPNAEVRINCMFYTLKVVKFKTSPEKESIINYCERTVLLELSNTSLTCTTANNPCQTGPVWSIQFWRDVWAEVNRIPYHEILEGIWQWFWLQNIENKTCVWRRGSAGGNVLSKTIRLGQDQGWSRDSVWFGWILCGYLRRY